MNLELSPSWTHVTWGAGGTTCERSLELAGRVQSGRLDGSPLEKVQREGEIEVEGENVRERDRDTREEARERERKRRKNDVCLHLTCTNVEKGSLDKTLEVSDRMSGSCEFKMKSSWLLRQALRLDPEGSQTLLFERNVSSETWREESLSASVLLSLSRF